MSWKNDITLGKINRTTTHLLYKHKWEQKGVEIKRSQFESQLGFYFNINWFQDMAEDIFYLSICRIENYLRWIYEFNFLLKTKILNCSRYISFPLFIKFLNIIYPCNFLILGWKREILLITSRYKFSAQRKIYTCLWYIRHCVCVYGYPHINIYVMGIDLLNIFYQSYFYLIMTT